MLIDCGLTDLQFLGNLLEGESVVEVSQDDVAADGGLQLSDGFADIAQFFVEALLGEDAGLHVELVEPLDAVLDFSVAHQVKASVAYAGEEVGFCAVFVELARMAQEELGEDVVHGIFAFCLVVQEPDGLPVHLSVVLFEQSLDVFFVCHTFSIHMRGANTKPLTMFFLQKKSLPGIGQGCFFMCVGAHRRYSLTSMAK